MSHDAGEVSWQTLRRIVQRWSGDKAELAAVSALDGGSISTTLMLQTRAGDEAVLKVSPHRVDRSYEIEAHQLRVLKSLGLPAPAVFDCHIGSLDAPDSYLLIERMPGVNLHDAKERCSAAEFDRLQQQLAEIVVAIHRQEGERYEKVEPQPIGGADGQSWPAFYRGLYDAIWQECSRHTAIPIKSRRLIGKIHDHLDRLLAHDDAPRLTHGDLWTSNVLAAEDSSGQWHVTALLDPNCRFSHAEAELAYLELFHTVTPAFNRAYSKAFRLHDDYHARRKHVYQLYELINHVSLFGDRYVKPLQATLEKLGPLV